MFLDDAPLVNGIFALFIIDFLSEESISFDDKTKIPLKKNVHFLSSVLSKRAQRFNIFTFRVIIEFFLNDDKNPIRRNVLFRIFYIKDVLKTREKSLFVEISLLGSRIREKMKYY